MNIHEIELGDGFLTFWCTPGAEMLEFAKELYHLLPEEIQDIQPKQELNFHMPDLFHRYGTRVEKTKGMMWRHFHIVMPKYDYPESLANRIIKIVTSVTRSNNIPQLDSKEISLKYQLDPTEFHETDEHRLIWARVLDANSHRRA